MSSFHSMLLLLFLNQSGNLFIVRENYYCNSIKQTKNFLHIFFAFSLVKLLLSFFCCFDLFFANTCQVCYVFLISNIWMIWGKKKKLVKILLSNIYRLKLENLTKMSTEFSIDGITGKKMLFIWHEKKWQRS